MLPLNTNELYNIFNYDKLQKEKKRLLQVKKYLNENSGIIYWEYLNEDNKDSLRFVNKLIRELHKEKK